MVEEMGGGGSNRQMFCLFERFSYEIFMRKGLTIKVTSYGLLIYLIIAAAPIAFSNQLN